MLRISSNLASLRAQRSFHQSERETTQALKELASGHRFVSAGSDPAGLAISSSVNAQMKGYKAAQYNSDNAVSFLAIAEGALAEQNTIAIRLRELAVQAASDTLSDKDRKFLDSEFQQLVQEFDRIAKSTRYGSQPLLDGTHKTYEFQVGVHGGEMDRIVYKHDADSTAAELDIDGLSVADKYDARDAIDDLDDATIQLNAMRARMGAVQSRLETASSHIATQVENLTGAYSKMAETDVADAISRARRGQVLAQYQAAALQMANEQFGNMIRLIA